MSHKIAKTAFNRVWKSFRKELSQKPATAALVCQLPAKRDVLRSMLSANHAATNYAAVENLDGFGWMLNQIAKRDDVTAEETAALLAVLASRKEA